MEGASPQKTPEKDSTQKDQTKNKETMKYEIAESEEEDAGLEAHRTKEACKRNKRKLKGV